MVPFILSQFQQMIGLKLLDWIKNNTPKDAVDCIMVGLWVLDFRQWVKGHHWQIIQLL